MSSSMPFAIDPEVEEILRKVAEDPGSTLLRVPRPRRIRGFFDRSPGMSASAAGLSPAERHLVRTYRGDVARLLREACRMKLIDGQGTRLHVSSYRSAHEEHVRWKPEELAVRARDVRVEELSSEELNPYWRLIDRCVGDALGTEPTVTELAEASIRLEPTDEARIMAAVDLTDSGAPKAGIQILQHVLEAPASEAVAMSARNNLGAAYSWMGEMPLALEHYAGACRIGGEFLDPWMNRLLFGLQLGRLTDVREAAATIEILASASLVPVNLYSEARRTLRDQGKWTPSVQSKDTIRVLGSGFGPATRRITSVFD